MKEGRPIVEKFDPSKVKSQPENVTPATGAGKRRRSVETHNGKSEKLRRDEPRLAGYVCCPFWSSADDVEVQTLHRHIPGWSITQRPFRNKLVKVTEHCPNCTIDTQGVTSARTLTFASESLPVRNPHMCLHDCAFLADDPLERVLGKLEAVEGHHNTFLYARRPPDSEIVAREADAERQRAFEQESRTRVQPMLDSSGRLVYSAAPETMVASQHIPTPEPKTPAVMRFMVGDEVPEGMSLAEELGAMHSARSLNSGSPSSSSSRTTQMTGTPTNKWWRGSADVIMSKVQAIVAGHLAPSLRGVLGRILFMECILDLRVADVRIAANSINALRSMGQLYRERGIPDVDGISAVIIAWMEATTLQMEKPDHLHYGVFFVDAGVTENPGVTVADLLGTRTEYEEAVHIEAFEDEKALLLRICQMIDDIDPVMMAAWDIRQSSVGYFMKRLAVVMETPDAMGWLSRIRKEGLPKPIPQTDRLAPTATVGATGEEKRALVATSSSKLSFLFSHAHSQRL